MCLFSFLEKKKTYICQLELLAVVVALHTFPDLFAGRLAHIFVDNEAAKSNLISGYSPHPDSARVVQMVGQQEDPNNFLLMHAMAPNVAGVIGSAIAAGVLWAELTK